MNTVQIVPDKDTGEMITLKNDNPKKGYVTLLQGSLNTDGQWITLSNRQTRLYGDKSTLQELINTNTDGTIKGQIVILEYLQNAVPQDIKRLYINKNIPFEEAVQSHIKTSGSKGIACKRNGINILRFYHYDNLNSLKDIIIEHDNINEIKLFQKITKKRS